MNRNIIGLVALAAIVSGSPLQALAAQVVWFNTSTGAVVQEDPTMQGTPAALAGTSSCVVTGTSSSALATAQAGTTGSVAITATPDANGNCANASFSAMATSTPTPTLTPTPNAYATAAAEILSCGANALTTNYAKCEATAIAGL